MFFLFQEMFCIIILFFLFFRSQHKRKGKDAKYGFGGKKRGMKGNTKESTFDESRKSNFKAKKMGRINKKKRLSAKK